MLCAPVESFQAALRPIICYRDFRGS